MILAVTVTSIIAFIVRKERFVMFILAAAIVVDVVYHVKKCVGGVPVLPVSASLLMNALIQSLLIVGIGVLFGAIERTRRQAEHGS